LAASKLSDRSTIEQRERDVDSLRKSLELERSRHQDLLARRVALELSINFRSSVPPSPASMNWSSRRVTAVIERMPVQRSSDSVRSSACAISASGLRDSYVSSHAIELGCDACAARQWSANCSPLVELRYSTSFSQFC
jgi:hypothetical protein